VRRRIVPARVREARRRRRRRLIRDLVDVTRRAFVPRLAEAIFAPTPILALVSAGAVSRAINFTRRDSEFCGGFDPPAAFCDPYGPEIPIDGVDDARARAGLNAREKADAAARVRRRAKER
jgi:hypothetical protein